MCKSKFGKIINLETGEEYCPSCGTWGCPDCNPKKVKYYSESMKKGMKGWDRCRMATITMTPFRSEEKNASKLSFITNVCAGEIYWTGEEIDYETGEIRYKTSQVQHSLDMQEICRRFFIEIKRYNFRGKYLKMKKALETKKRRYDKLFNDKINWKRNIAVRLEKLEELRKEIKRDEKALYREERDSKRFNGYYSDFQWCRVSERHKSGYEHRHFGVNKYIDQKHFTKVLNRIAKEVTGYDEQEFVATFTISEIKTKNEIDSAINKMAEYMAKQMQEEYGDDFIRKQGMVSHSVKAFKDTHFVDGVVDDFENIVGVERRIDEDRGEVEDIAIYGEKKKKFSRGVRPFYRV